MLRKYARKSSLNKKIKIEDMVFNPSFVRKVDKSIFQTCNILGTEVFVGSMQSLIEYIVKNIRLLSGDYLTITATNEIMMAYKNEKFFRCQNGGIMSIPDGGPLKTYGKKRGYSKMERITGPDLMLELFKISEEKGFRHYFYGTTQETLDLMREKLHKEYPGLQIAGMHPSLFRNLSKEEDERIVEEINGTRPDFVWFSLGAPKGNYFVAEHQGIIRGFMMSVGAGFDYYAGNIKRAPQWMQEHDLEWLYRIFQEPKRMAKRYFNIVPRFLWHAYVIRK